MTSHDLNDADGGLLHAEGLVVTDDFLHAGSDIFCRGTIAGAVVGYRQIVINGLGNAHETLRLVMCRRIIGQHLHRIHGIISARIEQALDIMLLHDLENLLVHILMTFNLGHLETAGAEECGRGSLQKLDSGLVIQILTEIDQVVLQEALNAVYHTIDLLYAKLLGRRIYAGNGRVDDSGRSAGLSNYNVSFHFDISFFFV